MIEELRILQDYARIILEIYFKGADPVFRRMLCFILIGVLCILIGFGTGNSVFAKENLITSQQDLLDAINAAEDGDVLLVGDIDFTAPTGIFNEMMRVQLRKSITISSGISGEKAVFTNGSFLLRGSKVSGEILECTFENIVFDGAVDTAGLSAEDWERPYDESIQNYTSQYPLKAQYAVSFTGNVTASFEGCVFQNYMYEYGAALWCRYRDYTDNPYYLDRYGDYSGCQLEILLEDCRFAGNAAQYAGGAIYLDGNEDNVTLRAIDCSFENNFSTLNEYGQGGGAIYAQYASVELVDCTLTGNEGNHNCGFGTSDGDRTRGGAIHMSGGELLMTNCMVVQNTASLGGGLCLTNNHTVLDGCVIKENRAANAVATKQTGPRASVGIGGAMYVETESAIPVSIRNSSIYRNSASIAYGGIYGFYNEDYAGLLSQGYGKLDFHFCTVAENTCDITYDYEDPDLWLWYTHPGNVWSIPYVTAVGCLIAEEGVGEELPTAENGYNYFSSEAMMLQEKQGHLISDRWEIPVELGVELLANRHGDKLYAGSNYDASFYTEQEEQPEQTIPQEPEPPAVSEPAVEAKKDYYWLLIPVGVLAIGLLGVSLLKKRSKAEAPAPQPSEEAKPQIVLTRYTKEQIGQIIQSLPQTQRLTPRELEVFEELLMGKKQGEIAYDLGISVPTVKDNARRIYDKLEVQNKNELFVKVQSVILN